MSPDIETEASPRIAALPVEERSARQRALLDAVRGDEAFNIYATLVRHPDLFEVWLPFCQRLLRQSIFADRECELIILRTAWRCGAVYEWRHHTPRGVRAGLTADQVGKIGADTVGSWAEHD